MFKSLQIDLVTERIEIERKIAELMSEDFPKLVLQNQVKPAKKGIKLTVVHHFQTTQSLTLIVDWNKVVTCFYLHRLLQMRRRERWR